MNNENEELVYSTENEEFNDLGLMVDKDGEWVIADYLL